MEKTVIPEEFVEQITTHIVSTSFIQLQGNEILFLCICRFECACAFLNPGTVQPKKNESKLKIHIEIKISQQVFENIFNSGIVDDTYWFLKIKYKAKIKRNIASYS